MEQFNQNKKGTCKCVDYYKKNGNYYIKRTKKTKRDVKCNNKTEKGSHFCPKHRECKKFLKKFTTGDEPDYDPIVG